MIGVEEAKRIMMEHVRPMPFAPELIEEVNGHVLAQDVFSAHPHPLFNTSAVDGYAISGDGPQWRVIGSIPAGSTLGRALRPGEGARIFTGAEVPAGTRCVLMQERCEFGDGIVSTAGALPPDSANVRFKGEQFQRGELLFSQGTRLDPAAIGMLASAGIDQVDVRFKPYVAVVRTGDEFIEKGGDPTGRIFSSNDRMLHAALHGENCDVDEQVAFVAEDEDERIAAVLRDAAEADVIISTGGVSVGDHDRVKAVLMKMGAIIHFHGVAQKPGKPMLFATLNDKPVFALPGNPRAVMVLFWEYVRPFILSMQGARDPWLKSDRLPLAHALTAKGDPTSVAVRGEFRAARVERGRVTLLADEGSHMLRSLVNADALAYLPAGSRALNEGEPVEIHYLPG